MRDKPPLLTVACTAGAAATLDLKLMLELLARMVNAVCRAAIVAAAACSSQRLLELAAADDSCFPRGGT